LRVTAPHAMTSAGAWGEESMAQERED
jgi:hypothetical protein